MHLISRHYFERVTSVALDPAHELVVEQCASDDERLSVETLFERRERLEKEHRQHRRTAARNDPGVTNASEVLNAEIIDVQLGSNESPTS